MCMKQKILEKRLKSPEFSTKHTASLNLDKVELFRTFKKYDRNMNGTLDFSYCYSSPFFKCGFLAVLKLKEVLQSAAFVELG